MTIATQTARIVYVPNGVTTEFSFGFSVLSPATVRVALGTTFITTGFTIELNADQVGSPGGKVIFTTPPVANDPRVVIFRWADFTQAMSYSAYDAFPAKSHERSLDTLEMQIQQMEDQIQRSYKVPFDRTSEEIPAPGDIAGADLTFPAPQKDMVLMWLNSTDPILVNGPSIGTFQGLVDQAESWATAAENSALAAQASSGQANSSAQLAQAWAESTIEVQPGKWSAKHWSGQASTYATNSANSATASANSATASAGSATLASKWADSSTAVEAGRYSAKYWADQAAAAMQEAITSLTSDDIDMIDPVIQGDIHARLLEVKKNRPNGIPKLTSAGKIEVTQLPISGMSVIGPFRGDDLCPKKGDVTCVPPDYRNPSQRFPNEVFHTGAIFLVTMAAGEASGHINLVDEADDIVKPIEVWPGDGIAYIDPADNVSGQPAVNVKGWYLIPGLAHGGVVLATNVFYDNTYAAWTGDNVQSVLDEISDYVGTGFVTLAGNQTITGTKTFMAGPVVANDAAFRGLRTDAQIRNFCALGSDNGMYFGSSDTPMLVQASAVPNFYDGTNFDTFALQGWVSAAAVMLTGNQTITGSKTFTANQFFQTVGLYFKGATTGGNFSGIFFQDPFTDAKDGGIGVMRNAGVLDSIYIGLGPEPWATPAIGIRAGNNITFYRPSLFTEAPVLNNNLSLKGLLSTGVEAPLIWMSAQDEVNIGQNDLALTLRCSNLAPLVWDGATAENVATRQWVTAQGYAPTASIKPGAIAGGLVSSGGGIGRQWGGLTVAKIATGQYRMTWTAAGTNCQFLTTGANNAVPAYAVVGAFSYGQKTVDVFVFGHSTHAAADSDFTFIVMSN